MSKQPPIATKIPRKSTEHGHERIDNYFWLADNEDPKVIEYLTEENAYSDEVMKHTLPFQDSLYKEMRARIKEEDTDVPTLKRGYYYCSETKNGKQYPIIFRTKDAPGSIKEVLLDGNEMAEGKETLLIGNYQVSTDNMLLGYLSNHSGSYMQFTLKIRDLKSNKKFIDEIENVNSFAWANDNRSLYYCTCNESLRPYRIYKHILGTDSSTDPLIYEEKDDLFNINISIDKTDSYLFIHAESFTSSETLLLPANKVEQHFEIFIPRRKDVKYELEPHEECFFLLYKDNENKNYKVIKAPKSDYQNRLNWEDFIPHDPKIKIEGIQAFQNHLVVSQRQNGLEGICVISINEEDRRNLLFPEAVYAIQVLDNPEYSSEHIRYSYSSLNRPFTIFEYNFNTKATSKLKEQEIPSGFNPDAYEVERLFAPSADNVLVPIALVYKKGLQKHGRNPLLLTGYGSYGISSDASFHRDVIGLIDRGFVFAIAQIRGGSDLGEQWYDDGKLFKKKNTFLDFIACAEYLISENYTSPEHLVVEGGSAGGLLMGAVINLRPELFKVVVAEVPFVDMLNTMLDNSLPLTTQEYEQWGNPNEKDAYEYMRSYSPYDNIRIVAYPNVLAIAGLNDSQVGYHEAAKWIAKLRENNINENSLMLLKTNMESGHGGATGRFDYLKEIAFQYAFMLDRLGLIKENLER